MSKQKHRKFQQKIPQKENQTNNKSLPATLLKGLLQLFCLLGIPFILIGCIEATDQSIDNQDSYLDKLPPLIDREIFFADPEITGAQISPNGEFVSFRKQHRGVMNIWVMGIDESFEDAQPVTADSVRSIYYHFWSRDSRYILHVQDKGGDENFNIYAIDPSLDPETETGVPEARNLTNLEGVRVRIDAIPGNTPNYIIVSINDRDPALSDVYRIDLTTSEKTLLYQNDHHIAGWEIDDDGNLRFAWRQTADGGWELLKRSGDMFEQVYEIDPDDDFNILRFHNDGRRLFVATDEGEDVDLKRLILWDPETGHREFIEKDPAGEVDFARAGFSDMTGELLATYYFGDRMRVNFHDEQFKKDYETVRKFLPEGDIQFEERLRHESRRTLDEKLWLVNVSRDVDPGAMYIYNRETGEVELLYRSRSELPTEHLSEMIPIRYTARDGLEIPAYLTVPNGVDPKNLPVIVIPHGGPWARDFWGYNSYAQFLANRGYAVFQPNFRGSWGYGKKFLLAGNKEWGTGDMQHDITDGVKYLIEEGIADPERIGIYGGSYGGYATLSGLTFTPDLYSAGVSFVGPSNLITFIESLPAHWAPVMKRWKERVGDPDDPEDRERLIRQSPLFFADQIKAPLMVVQGANDPRVKKHESDQIVVTLRDLDHHVEYILAPDEGHGFAQSENRLAFVVALERFFAEYLGGRYQKDVPGNIAQCLEEITVDVASVELHEQNED